VRPPAIVALATGNPGKVAEFNTLLTDFDTLVRPQSYWAVPEAAETGTTFIENAIIKARNACAHTGLPAIADDSGMEIPALDGEPGVYSARWAGPDADDEQNNARLIDALLDLSPDERLAYYRCVLVYLRHAADPAPLIAEGVWQGEVIETASGTGGFGYDPHFYLPEHQCTVAALDSATKNRCSHRGKALHDLRKALEQEWQSHP